MKHLDTLTALAQRTRLLAAEEGEDQRLANAVAFTHLAAYELAAHGFAAIKSTGDDAKHDIKPGFLVGRETREHIRIIANIDTPQQVVVWQELPLAGRDVQHVAPIDPSQNPALQALLAGTAATSAARDKGDKSKGHGAGAGHSTSSKS